MPLNKNTAYVTIDGVKATLAEMEELFLKELAKEDAASGKGLGFPAYFPKEYNDKLDKFQKEQVEMIETIITDNLSTELVAQVLEDNVKQVYLIHNPLYDRNPGDFGTFLETKMLGTTGTNIATADINTFRNILLPREKQVEVKGKIGVQTIDIGGITVKGLGELTALELQTVKNITMIYKMMIKMQNFLYMSITEKERPGGGGSLYLSFRVMTLFTSLYLRGLQMVIRGAVNYRGIVYTAASEPTYSTDTASYHVNYNLEFRLDRTTKDILTGIDRLTQIYLRHINLIDELSGHGISAREFFGKLRKLEGFFRIS